MDYHNYNRKSERNPDLVALYSSPLPSSRTGAVYNAFSYPTKISPETIAIFIACHTEPGEVVLDTFAGSGTTGLGAMLCDKPTEAMQKLASRLQLEPKWGPREAVLYEIGTLGAFVSRTMTNPPEPNEFEKAARALIVEAEKATGNIYQAQDLKNRPAKMRHMIWSDVLECDSCKTQVLFWDAAVRFDPLRIISDFACPNCGHKAALDEVSRVMETYHDLLLNKKSVRKKRVPVRLYGKTGTDSWFREVSQDDLKIIENATRHPLPKTVPTTEYYRGDLYRSGYHAGITHIHHFYTPRNLLAMAKVWEKIENFPKSMQDPLRLLALSYNATHSTIMARVVVKNGQKDFVLTGAQSGVLYVSSLPVEKNVFDGMRRKIGTFKNAFDQIYGSESRVSVINASSTRLHLSDNSVDYVFTDPPFGDFIPYSEVNQINEAWLKQITSKDEEIIISRVQGKKVANYQDLMEKVFVEIGRVLKIDGRATVVFHSSKTEVWQALIHAYMNAGFKVALSSILDKVQSSFKQVVSTISVKGDPLLLLERQGAEEKEKSNSFENNQVIADLLSILVSEAADSKERSAERLYSRYVNLCLEQGVPISLGAETFYQKVRSFEGVY
jgi:16S rRNA G966 N2-methylase RsmD